jgi:hypothetical protein
LLIQSDHGRTGNALPAAGGDARQSFSSGPLDQMAEQFPPLMIVDELANQERFQLIEKCPTSLELGKDIGRVILLHCLSSSDLDAQNQLVRFGVGFRTSQKNVDLIRDREQMDGLSVSQQKRIFEKLIPVLVEHRFVLLSLLSTTVGLGL